MLYEVFVWEADIGGEVREFFGGLEFLTCALGAVLCNTR